MGFSDCSERLQLGASGRYARQLSLAHNPQKTLIPHALPPPLIYEMPKLERYTYLKLKGQVLIVNLMTSKIVDMFPAT